MPADHDARGGRPVDKGGDAKNDDTSLPSDASLDDSEVRIRRALGLTPGSSQAWRPNADRSDQPRRNGGGGNAQGHKSRFVQDGDVPVVQMHARTGRSHAAEPLTGGQAPERARLAEAEAALRQERLAREQADRALREAQAIIHDLQTRLGHAELARDEAVASEKATAERLLMAAQPDIEAELETGFDFDLTPASQPSSPLHERPARKPRQPRRAREKQPAAVKAKPVKWWLPKAPASDDET